MQHVNLRVGKLLQPVKHLLISHGETVEDAAAGLGVALRHRLVCLAAIFLYRLHHRWRVGKHLVVGVYYAAHGGLLHSLRLQFRVRFRRVGPFLSATLVYPHSADVLQESCRAVYATLVGEVQLDAAVVYYSLLRLYAHQAPCSRTEVGEMFVLGGHCSHCACRVVTSHRNHRHCSKSCQPLHLFRQCPYHCCGMCHLSKLAAFQSDALYQFRVEVTCRWVEHLRSRCHGIFTHGTSCQHVAQCVGNEENFLRVFQGSVAVLLHRVELEERVEVHKLYSRLLIHLLLWHFLREEFLHCSCGVRVAVGYRVAQRCPVLSYAHEVASPSVYSNAPYLKASFSHES